MGSRWEEACKAYYEETYCLMPTDAEGNHRCEWTSTADNPEFECDIFWPTLPPPNGCCAGDSEYSTPLCNRAVDKDICQRMSSCHWITDEYGEEANCDWNIDSTTPPPSDPGCCMLLDQRPSSYTNGWDEQCKSYWNRKQCELPYTADGTSRCYWVPTQNYADCSLLWPTVEPTEKPTIDKGFQPGCCKSITPTWANKCIVSHFVEHCENLSECHWIYTNNPDDCLWDNPPETTTDAPLPGCCYANDQAAYSTDGRWIEACKDFWTEQDCLRPIDLYGQNRCIWEETNGEYDCSLLWPTKVPTPSPTMNNGCCKGTEYMFTCAL